MISEKQFSHAMSILMDTEGAAAKARAAAEHMDDLTKTVLAECMDLCDEKSVAGREAFARQHPRYREHLDTLRTLREEDYRWRNRRSAASAVVDAWRTEQSNARAFGRAA